MTWHAMNALRTACKLRQRWAASWTSGCVRNEYDQRFCVFATCFITMVMHVLFDARTVIKNHMQRMQHGILMVRLDRDRAYCS